MAIVKCPYCRTRISSLMKVCPHCKNKLGELSAEDQKNIRLQRWRQQLDRLSNLSFLALGLLAAGAGWWWFSAPMGWQLPPPMGAVLMAYLGAILYVVARVGTFVLKMERNRP